MAIGRAEAREMRGIQGWLAGWAAMLTAALAAAGHAHDAIDRGSFEAKLFYCETCHGQSGQGFHGYIPIPRLAGQPQQYIENQLGAFVEGRRLHPIMSGVAKSFDPSMRAALAAHFSRIDSGPLGGGPGRSLDVGRQLYEWGVPDSNVPACMVCHGDRAKGQDSIPRLAGQLYEYTVNQLVDWGKYRGFGLPPDLALVMTPTAHNLTRVQIEAIAAYLSSLH